jgi:uncharacterized membrane protein YfhO
MRTSARPFVANTNATAVKLSGQKFSAHRVEVQMDATAPALVVIAQTYYPCWRATVDGAPTTLLHANHAFQCVAVPAGVHTVKLVYEDRRLKLGAGISLAALVVCAGLLIAGRQRLTSPPAA